MKKTIIPILLFTFITYFAGCADRNLITPQVNISENEDEIDSYNALELLAESDCHFMDIKVLTLLPGILKAQFEDETGVYFYSNNFKNTFNANYSNAGIFITKSQPLNASAFAEKGSPNSTAVLSCDNLNFTKIKIHD